MDRFTFTDESSFQPGRVALDIEFTAGTSGAVPATLPEYTRVSGIDSIVLSATGVYTIHLTDCYTGLISADMTAQQDGYTAAEGVKGYPMTPTDVSDPDDPLVTMQMTRPDTGAAVAATEGAVVRINLVLQRLTPL